MFKTIQIIVMATLCLNFNSRAQSQSILPLPKKQAILGKVVSATIGEALPGAVLKVTTPNHTTVSNDKGEFILTLSNGTYNISISHLGYKSKSISIQIPLKEPLIIALDTEDKNLQEIEIVSTGYQNIPKERATGSFTTLNTKSLNRSVGINILDRLEGITSGLLLNRALVDISNTNSTSKISIRGRSTLFANAEPLIVLDGFPYDGNINQINAADISTITVLKDAAAASIWGTRAGNGVIVINTKKGNRNQKLTIGISSTFTFGNKPNINYTPQISSSDYIDLERYLFSKGYFNSILNRKYSPVSQVIEILDRRRNNFITKADSIAQINTLKKNDVRSDLTRYVYRPKIHQQNQLSISGGSEINQFYLSGGFDKNLENEVTNNYDRLALNVRNTFSLFKGNVQLNADVNYSKSNTNNLNSSYNPYSPYDQIADDNENALAVVHRSGLRLSYLDTAGNGKLLDWKYRPKDELSADNKTLTTQYRIKLSTDIRIVKGLFLSANYQYMNENSNRVFDSDQTRYYTRDWINRYSRITGDDVIRPIPIGNILNDNRTILTSNIFRTQLNFNRTILEDHEINAIMGYEGNDSRINSTDQTFYGYDPETNNNANSTINPLNFYPFYYLPGATAQIVTAPDQSGLININQSYFTNVAYTYKNRYIISGSARRDESNLFGVKTNQKGVPLWSTGISWIINKESFFNLDWVSFLKLRATYGYNGNVDKTVSGYLTAQITALKNEWGSTTARIINPPNPSLRWEKVKTWNLGLDYSFLANRINGSIDLYQKNSTDLIGNNPISMQTGITQFKGNGADLSTKGIDLVLNTNNLAGQVLWNTAFLFNYNTDKVTSYKIKQTSNLSIINGNFNNPLEGYPYYAIFSFPSDGLDDTGAPQGFLNGSISKDYTAITGSRNPDQLKFHGSGSPKYFGSLINTFGYKDFELSFNVVYKFGYYFRRLNVFSGSNYSAGYKLADFEKRWQKSGDEKSTIIPALVYPANSARDSFFQYSDDLIEKGDHIRLQDIRLSYQLVNSFPLKLPIKSANAFLYARNLGILWKKNKLNIDPDYGTYGIPQPFSFSIGLNINL